MFVTAELALGEQTLPAVPRSAIRSDGTQHHMFVVAGNQSQPQLEERLVQVVDAAGAMVPIVKGVKGGERVAGTVTPDVRDGARVK